MLCGEKSLLAEEWNQHPLMAEASFMMVQDEASCHKVKKKQNKTKVQEWFEERASVDLTSQFSRSHLNWVSVGSAEENKPPWGGIQAMLGNVPDSYSSLHLSCQSKRCSVRSEIKAILISVQITRLFK